jgi:chromosome segregation ATPase
MALDVRRNQQTSEESMQEQAGRDRKTMWALIIGGLGVVVAIVALVVAISATSQTDDNAKIVAAVRAEANNQIGGVRAELQKNVTAATVVLKQLQGGSTQAARARDALRQEVNANKTAVAGNQASIKALQTNVATLNTAVKALTTSVATLTKNQDTLTTNQNSLQSEVKALQKQVAALP